MVAYEAMLNKHPFCTESRERLQRFWLVILIGLDNLIRLRRRTFPPVLATYCYILLHICLTSEVTGEVIDAFRATPSALNLVLLSWLKVAHEGLPLRAR